MATSQSHPVFVTIVKSDGSATEHADLFAHGTRLQDVLTRFGAVVHTPCMGRCVCAKCVCLAKGALSEPSHKELRALEHLSAETVAALRDAPSFSARLSCAATVMGEVHVRYLQPKGDASYDYPQLIQVLSDLQPANGSCALAVDLGSTNVKAAVIAPDAGNESARVLGVGSAPNLQGRVSDEVLGRLAHANEEYAKATELAELAQQSVAQACANALLDAQVSPASIQRIAVVGNPSMEALFTQTNAYTLSVAPFNYPPVPVTIEPVNYQWLSAICAPDAVLVLAPPLGGHVGGDAWAAALGAGFDVPADKPRLLVDMGTNTEIVLSKPDGSLFCASTPAGPAFERAALKGSDLLEILKLLIDSGALEPDGRLVPNTEVPGVEKVVWHTGRSLSVEAFEGGVRIWKLDQLELRDLQLAVSAIYSGMMRVLQEAHVAPQDLGELILSGTFGSKVDAKVAVSLGLIPQAAQGVVRAYGKAALDGAIRLALIGMGTANPRQDELLELLTGGVKVTHVELGGSEGFNKLFLSNLSFEQRA